MWELIGEFLAALIVWPLFWYAVLMVSFFGVAMLAYDMGHRSCRESNDKISAKKQNKTGVVYRKTRVIKWTRYK